MLRTRLRLGLALVGDALREPEEFARRWHGGEAAYSWWVFGALALTAMIGTSTYGLTMGLLGGPRAIVLGAVHCAVKAKQAEARRKLATLSAHRQIVDASRALKGTTVEAARV